MNVTQATSVTGRVTDVTRYGVTKSGNVTRYVVLQLTAIDGVSAAGSVTVRIADDSALSGAIENSEYRDEDHTFILDRSGRITHAEASDPVYVYSVYSITDGTVNEDERYTSFAEAEAAYQRMVVAERELKKRSDVYEATTVTLYDTVLGDIVRTWTATEK